MTLGHSNYSIYLADPFGVRLADASAFISLRYTRVVNAVSTAILTLPGTFNTQMIRVPDGRLEIWRRLPSGREYLDTDTTWLIKEIEYERDDNGNQTIVIEADTPLCLLREPGRFVNYSADSASAQTTANADDALKALVRTNAGASATDVSRSLAAYLSVAADLSLAPAVTKQFAWRDVLKVIQEIASTSTQSGTYLAFDIIAPTPDSLEFRTYVQQRGVDHRFPNGQNPIIIGPDFGNMGACSLRYSYRGETTYAKAGGRGDGAARQTASAQDSTRIGVSPFGLREKFITATQYTTTAGLTDEAETAVRDGRPRTIFRGKLLDTPDTRYGVHWTWGDFVTVQAFGQSLDARIDAISVKVERGKETIEAWLRNDS